MNIILDKNNKTPLYLQLVEQIRSSIREGYLPNGYKLQSERKLAETLKVHRNTVIKAYSELKSENLIISEHGKGYIVNYNVSDNKYSKGKHVNWEAIVDADLKKVNSEFERLYASSTNSEAISFAGGIADRNLYNPKEVLSTLNYFLYVNQNLTFNEMTQDDNELKDNLCRFLSKRGVSAKPSNLHIFSENNQAMGFAIGTLISEGDKVLISPIISPDITRLIENAGGVTVAMPCVADGPILEQLPGVIEEEKPKLIVVENGYQNPTGSVMPMEKMKGILDISYRYRIPIIEWDDSSDLSFGGGHMPSIYSMDPGNNVVYLYSFSLVMAMGINVSVLVADKTLVSHIKKITSMHVVNTNWTGKKILSEFIKNGKINEKIDLARKKYRLKRDCMARCLDDIALDSKLEYSLPDGGVYIWVKLNENINSKELLRYTQKRGMNFIPGHLFFVRKGYGRNYIRLNYSYPEIDEIERGMAILKEGLLYLRDGE